MGPANVMTPIRVIVALGHTLAPVPNYTVGKHGQKVEGGWTTCPELLRSRPAPRPAAVEPATSRSSLGHQVSYIVYILAST